MPDQGSDCRVSAGDQEHPSLRVFRGVELCSRGGLSQGL